MRSEALNQRSDFYASEVMCVLDQVDSQTYEKPILLLQVIYD